MNPTITPTYLVTVTFDWQYPNKPLKSITKKGYISSAEDSDTIGNKFVDSFISSYKVGICEVKNLKFEVERVYTFDEWVEKYKPLKNHIEESNTYEGYAFETYGEELDFISEQEPEKIWTLIENGTDISFVAYGMRWIDREFYFTTSVPVQEEDKNKVFYDF
jgi:hypothetical protein